MSNGKILIVDDEVNVRKSLAGILQDEGYAADGVETGEECLSRVVEEEYECVLLDVWLPGMDGVEVLKELKRRDVKSSVIMISGHGTIETAVKAAKLGAFDFIEKPLEIEKTMLVIGNALKQKRLEEENRFLREKIQHKCVLIGRSLAIEKLRKEIELAAPTNGRVFIFGENGTGKELVARLVHALSLRSEEPFIEMNCAAVPEELIESELFGHEKGSFTGAVGSKRGKFELADEGTLFLDEIGDMSLKMQAKVLRVLQEQKFQSVGGSKDISVNVRVIAATNKIIDQEIRGGTFREDLFFRLNVIPLTACPLRERREDIPLLADHFLQEFAAEYGKKPKMMSRKAMDHLIQYPWPGNVRELKNIIERVMIMVPHEEIEPADLPSILLRKDTPHPSTLFDLASLKDARDLFEKEFIVRKLREHGGNISRTADLLGLERSNLHRKMKGYNILVEKNGESVKVMGN